MSDTVSQIQPSLFFYFPATVAWRKHLNHMIGGATDAVATRPPFLIVHKRRGLTEISQSCSGASQCTREKTFPIDLALKGLRPATIELARSLFRTRDFARGKIRVLNKVQNWKA
jgi:hypothetical protein